MAPAKLTLETFPTTAKDAHFKRARAYEKTKRIIRHKTPRMFAMTVRDPRDFGAGLVPTRKHTPPLKRRRYSIDVNTNGWNDETATGWTSNSNEDISMEDVPAIGFVAPAYLAEDLEPPVAREPDFSLPNPFHIQTLHRKILPPADGGVFLDLENSSISNEDFYTICDRTGGSCWWSDSILDVALELCGTEVECKRRRIEISNSLISTIVYRCGKSGDDDGNNFARNKEEKERFEGKKWIFLPINDGIVKQSCGEESAGCHWSFVVIDVIGETAHYVDSLFSDNVHFQNLAWYVARGVFYLIGVNDFKFLVEHHAPHQLYDNYFRGKDYGPCGPFVLEMIYRMLHLIVEAQDSNTEDELELDIPKGYGRSRDWGVNSKQTRQLVSDMILGAREKKLVQCAQVEHDKMALDGVDVDLYGGLAEHDTYDEKDVSELVGEKKDEVESREHDSVFEESHTEEAAKIRLEDGQVEGGENNPIVEESATGEPRTDSKPDLAKPLNEEPAADINPDDGQELK